MDLSFATRKFQRSIASLSLVAILASFASFAGSALASSYTDVPSWASDAVDAVSEAGIMTGYENGMFGGNDNLTRAQATKVLVLATGVSVDTENDAGFTDLVAGEWYVDYVNTAALYGMVDGYADGTFKPNANVNRAEFAKMVAGAFSLSGTTLGSDEFSDVRSSDWFDTYVGTVYENGVVTGYSDGTYRPGNNVTRAETAVMVDRAMNPETVEPPVDGGEDEEPTTGADATVMVELSDESMEASTLPAGATSVAVASFDVWSEGSDATLESLTVHQYGISDMYSDHEVYLYMGTQRLTSGSSVNSSTENVVFSNVDVELNEGEAVTLTVRMNVGGDTDSDGDVDSTDDTETKELGFEVVSAAMVDAGAASVEGDFPVRADKHAVSTTGVSTVAIDANGSLTDPTVGEQGATVAKFEVSAGDNDTALQELGLYVTGDVSPSEIGNFKLYRTGSSDVLATAEELDSEDVARFVFDADYTSDAETCGNVEGYCLEEGSSRSFYVTADFNTGRSEDSVEVYVDEEIDVLAVDAQYGFGAQVNALGYTSADASTVTLQGGDITMTRHNVEGNDLALDQNDALVMNFSITSETDVTLRNFGLKLVTTGAGLKTAGAANYTDIRVRAMDGSFTWGPIDSDEMDETSMNSGDLVDNDDTTGFYLFTDDLDIAAGESMEFGVYVDVEDTTALAGDTLIASVYVDSSVPEIKDADNRTVTHSGSLVPTSTFSGSSFTVNANSLDINLSSVVPVTTKVIGSEDVALAAFSMTAGDGNDITVTSLDFTGYTDQDGDGNDDDFTTSNFDEIVSQVYLYQGSVAEENLVASAGADDLEFTSFEAVVEAGSTEVFYVTGDIMNDTQYDGDRVAVDLVDASTDVEAEDESGNSITADGDAQNGGTNPSVYVNIADAGTLTFAAVTTSSEDQSQIVVAGTEGNRFGQFRFTAQYESYKVEQLTLVNDDAAYDDNIAELSVTYYTDEEQTVEASTTCERTSSATYECNFASGSEMMVPDTEVASNPNYATLVVEAELQTVSNGADTGDTPQFTLDSDTGFEARGVDSNTTVTDGGDDASANAMYVAATDVDFSSSSSFRADDVTLSSGEAVMSFTSVTNSAEDAELVELAFNIDLNEAFPAGIADVEDAAAAEFSLEINGTEVANAVTDDAADANAGYIDGFDAATGVFTVHFTDFVVTPELSGTDTITLVMDVASFVEDDSDATETLVISVVEGNMDNAGDVVWNDGSDDIDFTGVSASEKVQVSLRF